MIININLLKVKFIKISSLIFILLFIIIFLNKNLIRKQILDYKIETKRNIVNFIYSKNLLIGNSLVSNPCINSSNRSFSTLSFSGELILGINLQLENFDSKAIKLQHLFVWIGLNNILNGYNYHEITKHFRVLLNNAQKISENIAIIEIPEIALKEDGFFVKNKESNNLIKKVNIKLEVLCDSMNVEFLKVDELGNKKNIHSHDGVHLSCKFSQTFATKLDSIIERK